MVEDISWARVILPQADRVFARNVAEKANWETERKKETLGYSTYVGTALNYEQLKQKQNTNTVSETKRPTPSKSAHKVIYFRLSEILIPSTISEHYYLPHYPRYVVEFEASTHPVRIPRL